jgi:hypothetical protein
MCRSYQTEMTGSETSSLYKLFVPEQVQGARNPVIGLGSYGNTANSAHKPKQMFGQSQYTQHTNQGWQKYDTALGTVFQLF